MTETPTLSFGPETVSQQRGSVCIEQVTRLVVSA